MHCISCSSEINSKMKSALYSNICPFCGSSILEPHRAKSYADLIVVLDKVRLTNRDDVDIQIKEKLMDVLVKHFNFSKLDSAPEDDLISADDVTAITHKFTNTSIATTSSSSSAEEVLGEIPTRSVKATARKLKSQNMSPASRMYAEAAESTYGSDDDDIDLNEVEDLSSEEFQKYFPQTSDIELANKVDKYKKLHQERFKSSDPSKGIKRL